MKTILRFYSCLLAIAVPLLSGCSTAGTAKLIRELKNDPATVKLKVMGPGWTVDFERSFPTNWTK